MRLNIWRNTEIAVNTTDTNALYTCRRCVYISVFVNEQRVMHMWSKGGGIVSAMCVLLKTKSA